MTVGLSLHALASYHRKRKSRKLGPRVCARSGSYCSKKGLKAELRRRKFTHKHLAELAGLSLYKANGKMRTKKSLINSIVNGRKASTVARKLGITLMGKRRSSRRKGSRKGKCAAGYGRKKTGRRGCKKKPGVKRHYKKH